jgi:hypothetical protein
MGHHRIIYGTGETLESQIAISKRGHQLAVDLLSTPGLAQILDELRSPEFRKSVAGNALAEARKRGVQLPESGVSVAVRENLIGWEVEIQVMDDDTLYIFGFNSTRGFYMR